MWHIVAGESSISFYTEEFLPICQQISSIHKGILLAIQYIKGATVVSLEKSRTQILCSQSFI